MSICIQCDGLEFDTVQQLNAHIKSGHKTKPENWQPPIKRIKLSDIAKTDAPIGVVPPLSPAVPRVAKPIELHYSFTGECTKCFNPLDTIEVELGEKNTEVAYCSTCKIQYKQIEVVPIVKQFKPK